MKLLMKAVVVGALSVATVAFAEATDPTVIARQELMESQGASAKVLGNMASGKAPYDAVAAEAAKANLIATSAEIAAKFEPQATDPESEAKAEIWTNWDDYVAKANALGTAVAALDTTSVETIGAGMGAVGGACGACHKAYRE
jgi:cytochrome c556